VGDWNNQKVTSGKKKRPPQNKPGITKGTREKRVGKGERPKKMSVGGMAVIREKKARDRGGSQRAGLGRKKKAILDRIDETTGGVAEGA